MSDTDNIELISKDGEHTQLIPVDDVAEVTNLRAQGWATQEQRDAIEAAQQAADARVESEDVSQTPPAPGYSKKAKDDLEREITARNAGRVDDAVITVDEPGNKPQLIAALEADDAAQGGGQ